MNESIVHTLPVCGAGTGDGGLLLFGHMSSGLLCFEIYYKGLDLCRAGGGSR